MSSLPSIAILATLIFLTLTGCNRKTSADVPVEASSAADNQIALKLKTVKEMYAKAVKYEAGNQALEEYATPEFFDLLQMAHQEEGSVCGYNHDILYQSNDVIMSDVKLSFSPTNDGNIKVLISNSEPVTFDLVCDQKACKVQDVIQGDYYLSKTISDDCGGENYASEPQEYSPEQQYYNVSYRIESKNQFFGNQLITLNTLIIRSANDTPFELKTIQVNRGKCRLIQHNGQQSYMEFGSTYEIGISCDPQDVFEVNLIVDNDMSITLKPN